MNCKKLLFSLICILLVALIMVPSVTVFAEETTTGGNVEEQEPEKTTYPAMDLLNTDLSKYISLGEHKNIPITQNVYVTDEDLYQFALESNIYTEIKTRETAVGDIIKVSFVGNIKLSNGSLLPVQGGSGSGMIELGKTPEKTETLIDYLHGKTELVGIMPGKTAQITVNFPEDFSTSAMAGKEVVFTVTVDSVVEYGLTDAYVKSAFGCENIEAFREMFIKFNLQEFETALKENIFLTITKNSTVYMYPEAQYNYYYYAVYNAYKDKYDAQCKKDPSYATETSFEEYLALNKVTLEMIEENAKVSTEQDLVYFALYNSGAVGTMSEADYAQHLADLAASYGTTSTELETLFAGKHDLMNVIVANFVYSKLDKLAVVTTDYDQFKDLLNETTTQKPQETTTPGTNTEAAPCGVDITVVIIIAVLAVGVAVFVALLFIKKKEAPTDEDGEYVEDEEDEEVEEDDGEYKKQFSPIEDDDVNEADEETEE